MTDGGRRSGVEECRIGYEEWRRIKDGGQRLKEGSIKDGRCGMKDGWMEDKTKYEKCRMEDFQWRIKDQGW